jgi:hypothetical protein
MMICKADFQELFPDIFQAAPVNQPPGAPPHQDGPAEPGWVLAPNLVAFGAFWAPFAKAGFGWQQR